MKKQDVVIRIGAVGRRGDGVGDWQGQPVFVPRALPGETVRARLLEKRDQGIAAALLEVTAPSAERAAPPCPHYDSCGGCSLQHWAEEAYRGWKLERPKALLARAGLAPGEWKETIYIPAGTRRRATLAAWQQNGRLQLGYHRARSHDVADIESCLMLTPALRAAAQGMRPHLAALLAPHKEAAVFLQHTGSALDAMITGPLADEARGAPGLAARERMAEMAQACGLARLSWRRSEKDAPEIVVQAAPVLKQMGALAVELAPGAFMQPSAEGEAALAGAVLAPLRAAGARNVADLFAGSGTFAGPLLALGAVYAAESEDAAISALQKAGRGSAMLKTARRNLFRDPLAAKELAAFDAVVMDPPRMGAKEQAGQLAQSAVPLVVSVSCNPATFVRDALLLRGGGYRLESVQAVDQFVWSSHIELVGIFRR
jgi:23S rRNA (uracil1939-C5)-methyltransferase